jgi:hypothetical protein
VSNAARGLEGDVSLLYVVDVDTVAAMSGPAGVLGRDRPASGGRRSPTPRRAAVGGGGQAGPGCADADALGAARARSGGSRRSGRPLGGCAGRRSAAAGAAQPRTRDPLHRRSCPQRRPAGVAGVAPVVADSPRTVLSERRLTLRIVKNRLGAWNRSRPLSAAVQQDQKAWSSVTDVTRAFRRHECILRNGYDLRILRRVTTGGLPKHIRVQASDRGKVRRIG